jgi:hypothetical protein
VGLEGNRAAEKKFVSGGTYIGIRVFAVGWARSEFGLALSQWNSV